jgi:O-antigen ligase
MLRAPKLRAAEVAVVGYPALVWLPIPVDIALYLLAGLGVIAVLSLEPDPDCRAWPVPDLFLVGYVAVSLYGIAAAPDRLRALALSSALLPAGLLYLLASRYLADLRAVYAVGWGLAAAAVGLGGAVLLTAWQMAPGAASADLAEQVGSPVLIVPNDILWPATLAPFAAALLIGVRAWPARAAALLVLAITIVAIVLVQSRAAFLAFALGLVVLAWRAGMLQRGLRRQRLLALLGILAAACLVAVAVDALLGFPLARKFSSLCFSRGPFWSAAWSLFLDRPWLGHGSHSFVDIYQSRLPTDPALFCEAVETRLTPWPHNLWLELLSAHGVIGAGLLLAAVLWALGATWRVSQSRDAELRLIASGLLGAWAVFLFGAVFELSLLRLWVVVTLALLLGLSLRLRCLAGAD